MSTTANTAVPSAQTSETQVDMEIADLKQRVAQLEAIQKLRHGIEPPVFETTLGVWGRVALAMLCVVIALFGFVILAPGAAKLHNDIKRGGVTSVEDRETALVLMLACLASSLETSTIEFIHEYLARASAGHLRGSGTISVGVLIDVGELMLCKCLSMGVFVFKAVAIGIVIDMIGKPGP